MCELFSGYRGVNAELITIIPKRCPLASQAPITPQSVNSA